MRLGNRVRAAAASGTARGGTGGDRGALQGPHGAQSSSSSPQSPKSPNPKSSNSQTPKSPVPCSHSSSLLHQQRFGDLDFGGKLSPTLTLDPQNPKPPNPQLLSITPVGHFGHLNFWGKDMSSSAPSSHWIPKPLNPRLLPVTPAVFWGPGFYGEGDIKSSLILTLDFQIPKPPNPPTPQTHRSSLSLQRCFGDLDFGGKGTSSSAPSSPLIPKTQTPNLQNP